MSYLHTSTIPISYYSDTIFSCPSFTKILKINLKDDNLSILTLSPDHYYSHSGLNDKRFEIKIIKGSFFNNEHIGDGFEYHSTIRTDKNDLIEYSHIFYKEIKSRVEIRNNAIDDIIDED